MMSFDKIPLLITANFDVGKTPQVALSGLHERVEKHLEGLIAWLEDPAVTQIVFVKNCSTPIRTEVLEQLAASYGKDLEYLEVKASERTSIQGKGYGEGDLIRQALKQSRFLRDADEFIKVTGKLYSPQLAELFSEKGMGTFLLNRSQNMVVTGIREGFLAPFYQSEKGCALLGNLRRTLCVPWSMIAAPATGWIDTRIYRVHRDFYQEQLMNSHQRVHDCLSYTLEVVFYDDLKRCSDVHFIREMPIILGTSGTLGTTAGEYAPRIQEAAKALAGKLLGK